MILSWKNIKGQKTGMVFWLHPMNGAPGIQSNLLSNVKLKCGAGAKGALNPARKCHARCVPNCI